MDRTALIELAEPVLDLINRFPASGQLREARDREAGINGVMLGLIERVEVTKPCKCCGASRFDFSYFKPTQAGQIAAALRALAQPKEGSGDE